MKKNLLLIAFLSVMSFSNFVQAGTAILDDTDAGWTWTGFVLDTPNADCYGGFQHVSEFTGGTVEFNFTGSSIKFYGETWNGGASLEIFVDGVSKGTFSESITPEGLKNLFATITGLDDVNHAVKLVSIGEWASLDYVEYTSASIVDVPDPNVTVSGENPSWNEVAAKLADGDLNTKWSVDANTAWIQFAYKEAKRWNKYSLTSGNDDPTRDFKDWTLQASNDGTTWTILDTQTGHAPWAARNSTLDFTFTNLASYKFYKFDITANNGGNVTQLSEIAFSFLLPEEALIFTTTGSAASYLTWNNSYSHQADSVYEIKKAQAPIVVDGVANAEYDNAVTGVIKKIANDEKVGGVLDLSKYPQDETDLYTTFKALWTDNGVYMFFDVKDDYVRYQNTQYQWENDGIEFYFAKAVGDGKIQIIIPAMVGTPNPAKPAALTLESGSAVGSDPDYKVFGYDDANWDASLFNWAIVKTATGYTMEVYMDKDIVTNGNSATNFGKDMMFAGDINVDEADLKQNGNTPSLYVREGSLALLGNSNQEYANSVHYGYFKMTDAIIPGFSEPKAAVTHIIYDSRNKQVLVRNSNVSSVAIYNSVGQIVKNNRNNNSFSVSNFDKGMYIIKAIDAKGNILSVKKIVVY